MLRLQELSQQQGLSHQNFTLDQRLPLFIKGPCDLTVAYEVKAEQGFYLLNLRTKGLLALTCQRCMEEFSLTYENATILAVCEQEARAEELLADYECIVSAKGQIDLKELLIDELHLYAPQTHEDQSLCDDEINRILMGTIETY